MGRKKIPEKDKRTYGDWYGEKGEKLNASRAERYKGDPDYRKSVVSHARKAYRKKNGILDTGDTLLVSEGEEFVGLKITKVSEILKVDRQSILRNISLGYLPDMKFDNTKLKFITVDQLPILRKFFRAVQKEGSYKGSVQRVAEKMHDEIQSKWRRRDGSQKIIDQNQ